MKDQVKLFLDLQLLLPKKEQYLLQIQTFMNIQLQKI